MTPSPAQPSGSPARRLADIVGEAMALPEEARADYIRKAAGGDAGLEAEALSLVVAAGGAGGFLQRATIAASSGPATSAPIGEGPGSTIGSYRLLQQIGEGGFGVVFMAEQREPVRRQVALKIIKLGMDTRAVVARFEAERQALALMDHPTIAKVFDAGATTSGRPYFVMELVRGDPIAEYCDRHNLSTRERLDLFTEVCRGVQHAHTKGIIHRDLKPGNVLVTIVDGQPVPKIIDFGIAKATVAGSRLTDKTLFTEFRQVIGTPAYMSPEQADNAASDIDTRTDVYSLGVILYELLTGVTPFDPERLRSAAWGEMQRIIREEDPPKPSTRLSSMGGKLPTTAAHRAVEPGRLASMIRGDLDWIVMRCLEKDRTRRYQTADALAVDIQHALTGRPVNAAPPSTVYRLRKFARRNRGAVTAGVLVLAALVLGIAGTTYGLIRARHERDLAEHARRIAEIEEKSAQSIAEFLQRTLAAAGPSVALGRDTTMLREIMDKAAKRIDEGELADNPVAEIRLRRTIGGTFAAITRFDEADAMLVKALESTRQLAPAARDPVQQDLETAESLHQLAGLRAMYQRRMRDAEPLYREEVTLRRKHAQRDRADLATAISGLAGTLEGMNRFQEAEALHREAVDIQRRLALNADGTSRDTDGLADALHNLAGGLESLGKASDAEPLYREALAMQQRLHTGDDLGTASAMNNLAGVLSALGQSAEAEPLYRDALAMRQRIHKGDHPEVFISLNNLAYSLRARGRTADAEAPLRESLAMARRLYKGDHAMIASSMQNLAALLLNLKRPEEAEPIARESLEMERRMYGSGGEELTTGLSTLANTLTALDRDAEAEGIHREVLAIRTRIHGPDHPDTALSQTSLANVLFQLGRLAEAEQLYRSALTTLEAAFKGDHPRVAGGLAYLARCIGEGNDPARREEALILARRAADMARRVMPDGHVIRARCEKTVADLERRGQAPPPP